MTDHLAILMLAMLLATFLVYLSYKQKVDAATKSIAWTKDVLFGSLLIILGLIHLYLGITASYAEGEGAIWIFGRLCDAYMIGAGIFLAIKASVRKKATAT